MKKTLNGIGTAIVFTIMAAAQVLFLFVTIGAFTNNILAGLLFLFVLLPLCETVAFWVAMLVASPFMVGSALVKR